jgi:hypothetical protein
MNLALHINTDCWSIPGGGTASHSVNGTDPVSYLSESADLKLKKLNASGQIQATKIVIPFIRIGIHFQIRSGTGFRGLEAHFSKRKENLRIRIQISSLNLMQINGDPDPQSHFASNFMEAAPGFSLVRNNLNRSAGEKSLPSGDFFTGQVTD